MEAPNFQIYDESFSDIIGNPRKSLNSPMDLNLHKDQFIGQMIKIFI